MSSAGGFFHSEKFVMNLFWLWSITIPVSLERVSFAKRRIRSGRTLSLLSVPPSQEFDPECYC